MAQPHPRLVSGHAAVCAVFDDPRYAVPPVPAGAPPGTVDWLRATVSRFANGAEHERRRRLVEEELARLDVAGLRAAAHERASAMLRREAPGPLDVMAHARAIPLRTLAAALGAGDPEAAASDAIAVAAAYPPDAAEDGRRCAGPAVERLLRALGPGDPEVVANLIGVLAQACDATAALVGCALDVALRLPRGCIDRWPADALIAETLRLQAPVRSTRRVPAGDRATALVLDLAAANRDPAVFADPHRFDPGRRDGRHLTFGHGARACPGEPHAVALAGGMVEAVLATCALADPDVPLHPAPHLRLPARLLVTVR